MGLDVTAGNNAGVCRELQLGIGRLKGTQRRASVGREVQLRSSDVVSKSDGHLRVRLDRRTRQSIDFKGGPNSEDSNPATAQ